MNTSSVIEATGWTLVHVLWQGAAMAILLAAVLRGLKSASARYFAATLALAILSGMALTTFGFLLPNQSEPVSIAIASQTGPIEYLVKATTKPMTLPSSEIATPVSVEQAETRLKPNSKIPWQSWVVVVWLCGVGIFGLRFILDWRATLTLRKSSQALPLDSEWSERFLCLSEKIKSSRPVKLLISTAIKVPVVFGVLRPVVIVPVAMLLHLPPAQIDAILLHELAHVRRHDYLVNLLQSIVETLFFFHPAVW